MKKIIDLDDIKINYYNYPDFNIQFFKEHELTEEALVYLANESLLAAQCYPYTQTFIQKHKLYKNRDFLCNYGLNNFKTLSQKFIIKYYKYFKYALVNYIKKIQFSEDFLNKHWDDFRICDINAIAIHQKLSEDFIIKHWDDFQSGEKSDIIIYQKLSQSFINTHKFNKYQTQLLKKYQN